MPLIFDFDRKRKTLAGINSNALAHMGKDEPVTMEALGRICKALNCRLEDIVEYIPDSDSEQDT